jgi:hypothetical protein
MPLMTLRALISSPPAIWMFTCLGLACIGLAVFVMKNPTVVMGTGQDPAGKAMAAGFTVMLLAIGTMVFGLIAVISAWRSDSATLVTRIAASSPLAILALSLATGFVVSQIESARRDAAEHAAAMAIPLFLLVDEADESLTAMFNALSARYPITEMQLRKPGVLHFQLDKYVPRARLICLNADVPTKVDEAGLTNDSRLAVDDLARCKPTGPILLFSQDPAKAQPFAQKLTGAGWKVRLIPRTPGDDWVTGAFMDHANELLTGFVEVRPR